MNRCITLLAVLWLGLAAGYAWPALSIFWAPAADPGGHCPPGYTSYDLMVTIDPGATWESSLGVMELILNTNAPGSIYQQNAFGGTTEPNPALFGAFPTVRFDTYVTIAWNHEHPGVFPYPTLTTTIGEAVDIIGHGSDMTFNTQLLDVAWAPSGGSYSGPGTFHVARITLADSASGSWRLKAWKTNSYAASFAGVILPQPELYGDVDNNGFVGGADLTTILTYWSQSANRRGGDLSGDGFVGGGDYSELLGYWGSSLAPGDMGVPDPIAPPDDGFWGGADLTEILTYWGQNVPPGRNGDYSLDGFVGGDDYNLVLTYWGTSYSPEAIPEPVTLLILTLGGLLGLRRYA